MNKILSCAVVICLGLAPVYSKVNPKGTSTFRKFKDPVLNGLHKYYQVDYKKKKDIIFLKKETLKLGGASVPLLAEVMKSSKYPERNRWVATFLLGQIMGKKAGPYIAKFMDHPSWFMRLASLKTLRRLKIEEYTGVYSKALKDKSLLVRFQALDTVKELNLVKLAPIVWTMLYDKDNYQKAGKKHKRGAIIPEIIKTVGDLKFTKALNPLLKMAQKKKYRDIFPAIDYSLRKLTGKRPPKENPEVKKIFWKNYLLSSTVIK